MREKIKLESSAGTGHFYTTTKNKRTTPDKLEIKKYDPEGAQARLYKETTQAEIEKARECGPFALERPDQRKVYCTPIMSVSMFSLPPGIGT